MADKRKLIGIALAVVLGLGGTFLLLGSRGTPESADITREQVPMLVTAREVTAGTTVDSLLSTPGLVTVTMVNVEDKNLDALVAVDDLRSYKGLVVAGDLGPNAPLLTSSFVERGNLSLAAGGVEVPPDLLQVSFSLEPQRVLGGALRPGDRVAVVATMTVGGGGQNQSSGQSRIVVQKALVANVQLSNLANADAATTENGAPPVVGNYTVTLALSAADTERLTFALENGSLWLAKQPVTADGKDSKVWTAEKVLAEPVTDYAPQAP